MIPLRDQFRKQKHQFSQSDCFSVLFSKLVSELINFKSIHFVTFEEAIQKGIKTYKSSFVGLQIEKQNSQYAVKKMFLSETF